MQVQSTSLIAAKPKEVPAGQSLHTAFLPGSFVRTSRPRKLRIGHLLDPYSPHCKNNLPVSCFPRTTLKTWDMQRNLQSQTHSSTCLDCKRYSALHGDPCSPYCNYKCSLLWNRCRAKHESSQRRLLRCLALYLARTCRLRKPRSLLCQGHPCTCLLRTLCTGRQLAPNIQYYICSLLWMPFLAARMCVAGMAHKQR